MPAVALFWIDAEDHDFGEGLSCGMLGLYLDLLAFCRRSPVRPMRARLPRPARRICRRCHADLEATRQPTEFFPHFLETPRGDHGPARKMLRPMAESCSARGLVVFDAGPRRETARRRWLAR